MILARIREAIGRLWGATTTLVLSIGVAVLPLLQGIDPDVVHAHPALMWTILSLGIAVTVLRVIAPPPPSVSVHIDDAVSVDRSAGTVTITKASEISQEISDKAAGETMTNVKTS